MSPLNATALHPAVLAGCARAVVIEADAQGAFTLRRGDGVVYRGARAVLGLPTAPRVGDGVLVVAAAVDDARVEPWIVALTSALREAPPPPAMTVDRDPLTRETVVRFAPGAVTLEADGDLRLRAARAVDVAAKTLRAKADVAELESERAKVVAGRIETVADYARAAVGHVETRATRVVLRATDVFQEIESLAQTHAGRVRTVARDAVVLAARRVLARGDEDVKLKGSKIHIG